MRRRPPILSLLALLAAGCSRHASAAPSVAAPEPPPPVTAADRAARAIDDLGPPPTDGLTVDVAIEDPSGRALDALHAALARAADGEGAARLVFYGGSHTASDLFTGRIRSGL